MGGSGLSSATFIKSHELGVIEYVAAHGLFYFPTCGTAWQSK
jgi:hypothetical protein